MQQQLLMWCLLVECYHYEAIVTEDEFKWNLFLNPISEINGLLYHFLTKIIWNENQIKETAQRVLISWSFRSFD